MAASQRQIDVINSKLGDLQRDGQALHDALSSYVEHVMSVGRKWVECQGTSGPAFRHVIAELTKSWAFIIQTEGQITAGQAKESTDLSDDQASTVSPSVPMSSTLSSSSSFDLLSMSRPPSLADHLLIKLQDRLEAVEKEMSHVVEIKEEMERQKEGMDKVREEMDEFRAGITGLNDDMKKVKKTNTDMKGKVENILKKVEVADLKTELTRCVSRVDAIDKRRQLQVAVHAGIPLGTSHTLKLGTVLTCFTDVITNKGGHYDPSTGVFTAPVDGVYMTSLVHGQYGKNGIELTLYHAVQAAKPGPGGVSEEWVCQTHTSVQYTSCTDVNVVCMSAGDTLYVKMTGYGFGGDGRLYWPSVFFCYLIS